VARMLAKYQGLAESTGAVLISQAGLESALSDVMVWHMAAEMRRSAAAGEMETGTMGDVVVSVRTLRSAPSGGTLASALDIVNHFRLSEIREWQRNRAGFLLGDSSSTSSFSKPRTSPFGRGIWYALTGLVRIPGLPLQTTSISAAMDVPVVHRTWALLELEPARRGEAYGPDFSFTMFMRAGGWLRGMVIHWGLFVMGLVLATPIRSLIKMFVYQPGQGPDEELSKKDYVEFEGVATSAGSGDGNRKAVYCRAWFQGSMYYCELPATLSSSWLHLHGVQGVC
jgi:short subunit dehydrogenase-like uncharacterized protein